MRKYYGQYNPNIEYTLNYWIVKKVEEVIIVSIKEVEKTCPLCGQDNNCKHGQGGCWCDTVKFPKYILDLIPNEKRGKACICKSCLEKYQK